MEDVRQNAGSGIRYLAMISGVWSEPDYQHGIH